MTNEIQLVFEQDGTAVTDSLTVAEVFKKEHKHVIRDIEVQLEKLKKAKEQEWGVSNFGLTQYQHPQNNQWYPKYNLTENGFAILAMSYVTPEAMKMKVKFIEEFNRMRQALQNKNTQLLPTTYKEALLALVGQVEENEKLQLYIEEKKPLVTFTETVLKSEDNILVREMSKIIQDKGIVIGEKKLYQKLRDWRLILKNNKDNEPTQYAMSQKLFVVEERSFDTKNGTKLKRTPRVTPKGQVYIINRLKKEMSLVEV